MNNNEIIIIYQEVGKKPNLQKVKNDISTFEELLGGETEIIPYEDVSIICRKNRKNLKPNIYVNTKFLSIGETIRGNIIITCRENEKFKTLTKSHAMKCIEFLKNASFHYDNVDENGRVIFSKKKKVVNNFENELSLGEYEQVCKSNDTNFNDDVLNMILGIQTIILNFIKNNEN